MARQIEQALPKAPSASEAKFQIPLSILRPPQLVGRDAVWRQVEDAWLVRQAIFIRAPAGFGKTRFIHDYTSAKGETLRFEGRPSDALVPYASLARWLYRALGKKNSKKLEPWVSYELSRLIPELGQERASAISSDEGKLRFFEAAIQVIGEASWDAMAIVIDDLQFCDLASIEAMLYLQTKLIPSTLLSSIHAAVRSISAYRQGELAPEIEAQIETLVDQGMATIIDLKALVGSEVEALLRSLDMGLDEDYIVSFAKRLQAHTGGNPLFIVESLKSMFESGGIHNMQGDLPLPDKVGRLLENRLERLSPMSYQLLRVLALRPNLDPDVAADVLNVDLFEISQAYEILEQAQMLRDGKLVHDLLEETVTSVLPDTMKRYLHQRLAEQLEQDEAQAHLIAYHWSAAGKREKALPWRLEAAKQASLQGQLSQAQSWLSEILVQEQDNHASIEARVLMGRLLSSFDVNQSRRYLSEALEASRERGFRDLEVQALIALAQLATVMGNQQEAQTWISQALAQRQSINDDDLALELTTTHFNVAVRSGQVAQAEAILNDALTHFDKPQLVLDIALLKWHQGDFREGARLLEKLIAEQPVLSQIMTLDNNLGMTYWALGESERALTRLRESTRIWQMQGATYQEALSRSNLGLVYTSLGYFAQAQDELAYAETAFKSQGSMTSLADVYQRQATLTYYAGRYQEALHYHEQASELMRNVGDIFRVSYSLATHANCLSQLGQPAQAKQMSEEAIGLAELTGHPLAIVLAYQSAAMTGLPQALKLLEKAQALALQRQMTEQWALCVWLEAKLCKESRHCLDKLQQALAESRRLQLQVVSWLCLQQLVRLGEPLQDECDQAYELLVSQAPVDWFMVQADGARLETHSGQA